MTTEGTSEIIDQNRRQFLSTAAMGIAAAGAISLLPMHSAWSAESEAIRPFRVEIPEADLVELRNRLLATRWADRETVTDQSQGVQLTTIQQLVQYWRTEYDWRKMEARLNVRSLHIPMTVGAGYVGQFPIWHVSARLRSTGAVT